MTDERRPRVECGAAPISVSSDAHWGSRAEPWLADQGPGIEIAVRAYDHVDATTLVHALFVEQTERYGYADPAQAAPSAYAPPGGIFLVVYTSGQAVSCGGYRSCDLELGTVEIKKMYTLPPLRGRGYGRITLSELERRAAASGARRAIIETGVRNQAALKVAVLAQILPVLIVAGRQNAQSGPSLERWWTGLVPVLVAGSGFAKDSAAGAGLGLGRAVAAYRRADSLDFSGAGRTGATWLAEDSVAHRGEPGMDSATAVTDSPPRWSLRGLAEEEFVDEGRGLVGLVLCDEGA